MRQPRKRASVAPGSAAMPTEICSTRTEREIAFGPRNANPLVPKHAGASPARRCGAPPLPPFGARQCLGAGYCPMQSPAHAESGGGAEADEARKLVQCRSELRELADEVVWQERVVRAPQGLCRVPHSGGATQPGLPPSVGAEMATVSGRGFCPPCCCRLADQRADGPAPRVRCRDSRLGARSVPLRRQSLAVLPCERS